MDGWTSNGGRDGEKEKVREGLRGSGGRRVSGCGLTCILTYESTLLKAAQNFMNTTF